MKYQVYIAIFFLLTSLACKKGPCSRDKGDVVSEKRDLKKPVNKVLLRDNLNVEIYLDSGNYIEISAGENLMEFIQTTTEGASLTLENNNKCNFLRKFDQDILLKLHLTSLELLIFQGSGSLVMKDTINTDIFTFQSDQGTGSVKLLSNASRYTNLQLVEGFADVTLYGKGNTLYAYNTGSAWIHAENYDCQFAGLINASTGDIIVNAEQNLSVTVNGIGNIQYYGNPTIEVVEYTGSGRLIPVK